MKLLYNGLILLLQLFLPLTGIFSDKMKRFTKGRQHIFQDLEALGESSRQMHLDALCLLG